MKSSEFACPHCGSILNLSGDIADGTSVDCLVCMRSFGAKQSTAAPMSAVSARPVPSLKARNKQAAPRSSLANSSSECCNGVRVAAISGACVLLFLMAGAGFAWWRKGPESKVEATLAQTAEANAEPNVVAKKTKGTDNPPEGLPDDDEKPAGQGLPKVGLVRTKVPQPLPDEPAPEPVVVLKPAKKIEQKIDGWGLDQQKIDASIDQGIAHLRATQNRMLGAWSQQHEVGCTALGGLTLLECDVPATDPAVRRAAALIRNRSPMIEQTYELSLAILFLDRLGDPMDRVRIQGMALRLLAGQNNCGGWTYVCPLLDAQEMHQLYTFLQANRPAKLNNALPAGQGMLANGLEKGAPLSNPIGPVGTRPNDPFVALHQLILKNGLDSAYATPPRHAKGGPAAAGNDPAKVDLDPANLKKPAPAAAKGPARPDALKPNLRGVPIVAQQGKAKQQMRLGQGLGDNSNTQFAMLALWAARRHDLPTDPALLLAYQRFLNSQTSDGGWAYMPNQPISKNTMTCVGLLGLAMGHAAAPDGREADPKHPKEIAIKPALEDVRVQRGLRSLAQHIGDPTLIQWNVPMQNLYLLWSVERVAMLYDLKLIGGKNWYSWGAQRLVLNQMPDGSWINSPYHGANTHTNTCFALLFLKRSNLVQDLTNELRLQTGINKSDVP